MQALLALVLHRAGIHEAHVICGHKAYKLHGARLRASCSVVRKLQLPSSAGELASRT